jgi:hypothetical protein
MKLRDNNGINTLRGRITTAAQLVEFVSLWTRSQHTHLIPGTRDSILWKCTTDRVYSTRSAYQIQFGGSYEPFRFGLIWKAHAENKCKVFAWTMAREKILTSNNLQKGAGHNMTTALYAMGRLRHASIWCCSALLPKHYGA